MVSCCNFYLFIIGIIGIILYDSDHLSDIIFAVILVDYSTLTSPIKTNTLFCLWEETLVCYLAPHLQELAPLLFGNVF